MLIKPRNRLWVYTLAAVFASFAISQASAQSYPDRPVHIIVGVSPGGVVDTTARILAKNLSKLWGQPVVVDSRLGAAGAIANELVAQAPADGYTLLFVSDDIAAVSALHAHLPYDLQRDLAPVSLVAVSPGVLLVGPSLHVDNAAQLIALAKKEPGQLKYGSSGVGSSVHLNTLKFASMAHINIVHVPYKGAAASMVGIAGGEIDMTFGTITAAKSFLSAGKLKFIAVTSPQRSPLFPSVPTVSESGLPGYTYTNWFGVFAPAKLPPGILAKLNADIAKVDNTPEMQAALTQIGNQAQTGTPQQFAQTVSDSVEEKAKLVKMAGLKPQ